MTRGQLAARLRVGVAALALAALGGPALAQNAGPQPASADEGVAFDIADQALGPAVTAFGLQSGYQVSVDPADLAGLRGNRVTGRLKPVEALSRLLAGTGVTWQVIEPGSVALHRMPAAGSGAVQLAPVTVLGSRALDVPISNVPASISYVEGENIRKDLASGARIEDVLVRRVPGFNTSNLGVRMIRGRTAQVFMNGAPTNEQLQAGSGSDINVISPDHVGGIEVSRGANSAYGFGSPGGIIALTTPRAESEALTLNSRLRSSFNTSHPHGSFQTTLYQSAAQIVDAFDYHVGVSFTRDGVNRAPDGRVANIFTSPALLKNGRENIYNVDSSLGYDLGEAGRFRLTGTYQHIDYLDYYETTAGLYREVWSPAPLVPGSGAAERKARTVDLSYENDGVWGSTAKLELFGSDVDSHRPQLGDIAFDSSNSYIGLRSAVTTPLDAVTKGLSLSYGVDASRNRLSSKRYDLTTRALNGVFGPPTTLDMVALFGQGEVPLGRARLSGGVRHEMYGGKAAGVGMGTPASADDGPGGDIGNFNLTLFNAGLLQPLADGLDLTATYTQGAEISQLARASFAATSIARVDPQAARSHQYELGLRHGGARGSASLTGFYTHSRRLSALDCSAQNAPCVPLREPRRFWGLELAADWQLAEQWALSGTVSWQDGRRKAAGAGRWTRVSSAELSPLHGSLILDYAPLSWWQNSLTVDWRARRARIADGYPYGEVHAVALVHLSTSFQVGPGTLELGIHNLLDKTYTSIQAEAYNGGFVWLPEQGRRISAGYSVTW